MCVRVFVKGRGLRKGEGDGAGEHWHNIIKIGWPSQGSACYCLFNLKKMACKNRQVAEVFLLLPLCILQRSEE